MLCKMHKVNFHCTLQKYLCIFRYVCREIRREQGGGKMPYGDLDVGVYVRMCVYLCVLVHLFFCTIV